MTLEQKLAQLQGGKPNALYLEFNDHWTCYETIEAGIEQQNGENFVSEADRQKCIETNSLWVVTWYVNTPVGHICVCGSSLDVILDYLLEVK